MKSKKMSERAQALIVIALAAMVLFGFVALAIDGSVKFSDRRHAQNAADTAALAGSLALVNDETSIISGSLEEWEYKALMRAEENGYDDFATNEVWVFKCSDAVGTRDSAPLDCGPYEGDPNYVAVVILSHINTTFARVLGINQTHNLVSAVTYWNKRGPMYDGNLIVALKPTPCSGGNGNIKFSGAATITLDGGGAFVNSTTGSCGITRGGSNCPVFVDAGLGSAGSGNINISPCTLPSPTTYNVDTYPFPPDMPDEPAICSGSQPVPTTTTTLNPGHYSTFPPAKNASNQNMSNNIVLNPGIYCLDTALSLSNNKSITGSDVLIYIRSGVNNPISISGGTINLSGRQSGDYDGYVIIVASSFSGQSKSCIINGGSGASLTGTIFAPYCDIKVTGNNATDSFATQIIGYTVEITGLANTNLQYVADDSAQSDPKIGLMR